MLQRLKRVWLALILVLAFSMSPALAADQDQGLLTGPVDSVKIVVLSDPHYFDPKFVDDGEAFQQYLASDTKMLAESQAILESALDSIRASDASIVLIPGDLTKDGELISHQSMAKYLKDLERSGKEVYVINGNHDINNPHAVRYKGDSAFSVNSVSPNKFKNIYKEFGYKEAIAEDPNSLSYVVEPAPGLRIIAVDSCSYDQNYSLNKPVTAGSLPAERLHWITGQIAEAEQKGMVVLGFMHHGLIPNFAGQEQVFPEYVVSNWHSVAAQLAQAGLKVIFTGHFHAQDIANLETGANFIFDIQTGSLVTYPSPYRLVELTPARELIIQTQYVQSINYDTGGKNFHDYSIGYLMGGLYDLLPNILTGLLIQNGFNPVEAQQLAAQIMAEELAPGLTIGDVLVRAVLAHYAGDESFDPVIMQVVDNMIDNPNPHISMLGGLLQGLMVDPYPCDNNLTIDLVTGGVLFGN